MRNYIYYPVFIDCGIVCQKHYIFHYGSIEVSTDNNVTKEDIIRKMREMLADLITLDVITAKGNYEIINQEAKKKLDQMRKTQGNINSMNDDPIKSTQDWIDLVKILSKPPEVIEILARTHIQLDGDRVDILPSNNLGTYSQQDILNFHQESVNLAMQNRTERFQFIVEILKELGKEIDDIFPDKLTSLSSGLENESKKK
jgi:hypothetical protein